MNPHVCWLVVLMVDIVKLNFHARIGTMNTYKEFLGIYVLQPKKSLIKNITIFLMEKEILQLIFSF